MADFPPDNSLPDPNSAQRMAQRLDPAVETALRDSLALGDNSIQQFIERQGITTTDQLVQAAENGFIDNVPQNIQDIMEQRNRAFAQQGDDELARRSKKQEAEADDIAERVAQNNEALAAGERERVESEGKSYSAMNEAEKAAFLDKIENMTANDWHAMSTKDKKVTAEMVTQAVEEGRQDNDAKRKAFDTELLTNDKLGLGDTPEERKKNAQAVIEIQENARAQVMKDLGLKDGQVLSEEQQSKVQKQTQEKIGELSKEQYPDNPQLQEAVNRAASSRDGFDIRENRLALDSEKLKTAKTQDELDNLYNDVHKGVVDKKLVANDANVAVQKLEEANDKAENAAQYGSQADRHEALQKLQTESDGVGLQGITAAIGNTKAEAIMEQARVENREVRKELYTKAAPNGVEINADTDLFDAQPEVAAAPLPDGNTIPRLSINAQPLADSGLDKLGALAANNDPAPEIKKKAPSSGMGGMGT